MEKLWYAIMRDCDDPWDNGTFDKEEAIEKMLEENDELEAKGKDRTAIIAVIDAGYDDSGMPTIGGFCVDEITEDDI